MTVLSSPAVVLTTAMAVSGTLIFLALRRERSLPHNTQSPNSSKILRSCLNSDGKRKKKKKRVRFADSVREQTANGDKYRKKERKKPKSCRLNGIQQNREALYSGILRDRVQRMRIETAIF